MHRQSSIDEVEGAHGAKENKGMGSLGALGDQGDPAAEGSSAEEVTAGSWSPEVEATAAVRSWRTDPVDRAGLAQVEDAGAAGWASGEEG